MITDISCGVTTVVFIYNGNPYYFCDDQLSIEDWYVEGFIFDTVSLKYVLLHFPEFSLTFQKKFGILPTDKESV